MAELKHNKRKKGASFSSFQKQKTVYSSTHCVLRIARIDEEKGAPILHIIAPKKEFPTAIKRNLIKRRIRHIFSSLLKNEERPLVFLCFVKKSALLIPFSSLREEIHQALK